MEARHHGAENRVVSLSVVHPALVGVIVTAFVVIGVALTAVVFFGGRWLARRLARKEPLVLVVDEQPPWRHLVAQADVAAHACGPCNRIPGAVTCACIGHCGRQGCRGAYSGPRRRLTPDRPAPVSPCRARAFYLKDHR